MLWDNGTVSFTEGYMRWDNGTISFTEGYMLSANGTVLLRVICSGEWNYLIY